MAPFNPVGKAPGVYIEEVQVPGPIAGVGTSTVAFIGPARRGPINTPTRLTNWTQFVETFGVQDDLGPYIIAPTVYVAHAVRGFFDNGGRHCYFVRAGAAVRAWRALNDRETGAPQPTLRITAKKEGVAEDAITVEVQDAHLLAAAPAARVSAPLASAALNHATLANADDGQKFRPGDSVSLEEGSNKDRATIESVSGKTVTFREVLGHTYTGAGAMRIADLVPGQTRIRLADTVDIGTIEPGAYVQISQGTTTESKVVQKVEQANRAVALDQGLTHTYNMAATADPVTVQTLEFALVITPPSNTAPPRPPEVYQDLSIDPRHSHYFGTSISSATIDVTLADPPSPAVPPGNLPAVRAATPLEHGSDDNLAGINATHYKAAIDALKTVDDVNIICIPDRTDQDVQSYLVAHCEAMQDRFAILDPQRNAALNNGIVTQRNGLVSDRGYAALYYPWIVIANPVADGRLTVPPSGHIAGVYARVDDTRGVHKAPANEPIRGALDLERLLTDDDQGGLNDWGINVIRSLPGSGVRVWGARTIAKSTQWRYVNVRRLLLFIEESIQEGTQFAVFEPNDLALWGKLKRQVTDFLTRVWRTGALFGATADQAFRVRVDEELNPRDQRALGQLVIEVIVVPTTPAEFIVFQIISDPTGNVLIQE
jgi:uncharacterized protein